MSRGDVVDNPCVKDCPERSATCHAYCEKYARFAAWCERRRKERAEERALKEAATHGMKRAMAIKQYRQKQGRK